MPSQHGGWLLPEVTTPGESKQGPAVPFMTEPWKSLPVTSTVPCRAEADHSLQTTFKGRGLKGLVEIVLDPTPLLSTPVG